MKRLSRKILFFLIALLITTLACSVFTPDETPYPLPNTPDSTATHPAPAADGNFISQEEKLTRLYEQANPGVVSIRVYGERGGGLGSGFVIDKEGHIVTNYHVVRGADELEIAFPSGYKARGEVLGTDSDSDIAVIYVDAPPDELHPLPLGDSNQIQVGQVVAAIGNPLGYDGTMTVGIISSLGRTLDSMHAAPGGSYFTAGDIIQTDAPINPGNSGGPLLNLEGEVIGVNFAIDSVGTDAFGQPVNSGIGFAISINIVKRVTPHLIRSGSYDYPYLGITSLSEITLRDQEALNLPQASGVYILEVTPGSPADIAGLRGGDTPIPDSTYFSGGDLITAIDDQHVQDFSDLISYLLNNTSPGDTVVLTILRDGEPMQINLILGKRP